MEEYNVVLLPAAQSDFQGITEYLFTMPPEEAMKSYEQFMNETKVLQTAPKSCSFARDSQLRLRGYRMLSVKDYLLFFVISANTVEIRRILYARWQYDRLM
jgi:plasmid stabilization system protein ParE